MPADPATRSLGRFAVSATGAEARRFGAAVPGAAAPADAGTLPLVYPVIWLGRDDIRAALRAALGGLPGGAGRVPVHLSQSVSRDRPLCVDAPYWLDVEIAGPDGRDTVALVARVSDGAGAPVARLDGQLALVAAVEAP